VANKISWLPNLFSALRIPLGLALLMCAALSAEFMTLYLLCCLTDVLDGYLARRLNARSELGARLDSAADFILLAVLLWKLLPVIAPTVPVILWIAVVALIRFAAALTARIRFGRFGFLHTWGNKLTGILLGIYPLTLLLTGNHWPLYTILVSASVSAIEELLIEMWAADWHADRRSVFSVRTARQ